MKALTWQSRYDVRIKEVTDPVIQDQTDIIIKVTSTAICGSDLHLLDGYVPEMKKDDVLGHEFMGEVVEVGKEVKKFQKGDRVVVPFVLACGSCFFCDQGLTSACDNSNPDAHKLEKLHGHGGAGLFGYSHLYGGYSGGQAEYVRVPFADHGPIKVPDSLSDEQVLFLSDIYPTAWMAAENAQIKPGDTVAVWGCGPVGQLTIKCAWLQGAGRVIAIDQVPERLEMAYIHGKAETIDFSKEDVKAKLNDMTSGRGPDCCIDAVGAEAHGWGSADAVVDQVKTATGLGTDHLHVLRESILNCRKGGTVSIPGVYVGMADKLPIGAAFGKGLTLKMGQTHVQRYLPKLLQLIIDGQIDPSYIITHRLKLDEAPQAYKTFKEKKEGCIKVVLTP